MRRAVESVRARLALWHTAALATLLVLFAVTADAVLVRTTAQRTDRYLAETADALRLELLAERAEEGSDSVAATQTLTDFRFRDLTFIVYDRAGRSVTTSLGADPPSRPGEERAPGLDVPRLGRLLRHGAGGTRAHYLTLRDDEGGYRAYALPVVLGRTPYLAVTVQSLHAQAETLEKVRDAYLLAIPVALALSWLGGYLLARRSLAPVAAMSREAAAISAANLHARLPVLNPRDELGQLAGVLNALLGRVHDAFEQQRRFTADASHELRTPVAVLRSEADVALARDDRPAGEYRDALAIMQRATRRMGTIVEDLFLLARADSGEQPLRITRFYLDELAAECVETVRSLAAQRGIALRCEAESDCEYTGDEELLRRLVLNLLDNAIKYSHPGADVVISVGRTSHRGDPGHRPAYQLTVVDTGPGIPTDEQPRIFDRFYRVDGTRSPRATSAPASNEPPGVTPGVTPGGAGLGLSIARWVADAHGGELRLARSTPAGSEFVLTLPDAPDR